MVKAKEDENSGSHPGFSLGVDSPEHKDQADGPRGGLAMAWPRMPSAMYSVIPLSADSGMGGACSG